jgi:secreted trypsin-like serine protease
MFSKVIATLSFLHFFGSSAFAYDGGTLAKPGEYPTLRIISSTGSRIGLCGGVMINPRLLLTAAHCASPPWSGHLTHLLLSDGSSGNSLTAPVNAVYLHPDKMREIATTRENPDGVSCNTPDIALVELTVTTKFKVVPIDSRPNLQFYERLITGGYGSLTPQQEAHPDLHWLLTNPLKIAERQVASVNSDCFSLNDYDSDGTGESTTLKGDSGSPVYVRYTDGTLGVVGVVSSGMKIPILPEFDYFARLDDGAPASVLISKWVKSVLQHTASPAYIGSAAN